MKNAHPNKVFCSNKGKGNCKDSFNNRLAHRIERSKEWSGQNERERKISSLREDSDFGCGLGDNDPSWDAHKDC